MYAEKPKPQIHQTGRNAELAAIEYLKNKSYIILTTNYHSRYGEIDIIASVDDCLVFIEVKGSESVSGKYMYDRVSLKKQRKLYLTAQHYLQKYSCEYQSMRFDVLLMSINSQNLWHIEHIVNAFSVEE